VIVIPPRALNAPVTLHESGSSAFTTFRRVAEPVDACLVVGVHVVVLHLRHGPPVILVDNPGELVLLTMKGEGGMTDAAAPALRVEELANPQGTHAVPRLPVEAMDEVEVDMLGLKPLELPREVAFHFIRRLDDLLRELRGEQNAIPKAPRKSAANDRLTLPLLPERGGVVESGRIHVIDALFYRLVKEARRRGLIDLVGRTRRRQPHAAKTKHGYLYPVASKSSAAHTAFFSSALWRD
jgi:hypothetical protein